ncbi:hypothetical protein MRB53_024380 [Persea americana]|uniref:Uncharacterized protein n=1 Tax=Persea americana TaxID=3435 RepID=A0ACC2LCG8_PERAE|nr:hypothetical protein MRB53_024380 [Persea americana]
MTFDCEGYHTWPGKSSGFGFLFYPLKGRALTYKSADDCKREGFFAGGEHGLRDLEGWFPIFPGGRGECISSDFGGKRASKKINEGWLGNGWISYLGTEIASLKSS